MHVIVLAAPPGDIDRDGGDWFYHALVTDQRDQLMIRFIESVTPQIADVAEAFAEGLRQRGLDAVVSDASVLPEMPAEPETLVDAIRLVREASRSMPRASADIDEFVLVLALRSWGVRRDYAGVVPIGLHEAHFELSASLVDARNPLVPLWSTPAEGAQSIERRWNEPPDFPKVHEALALALDEAVEALEGAFFAWDGVPGSASIIGRGKRVSAQGVVRASRPPRVDGLRETTADQGKKPASSLVVGPAPAGDHGSRSSRARQLISR